MTYTHDLIKSLFSTTNNSEYVIERETFEELKKHSIETLFVPVLSQLRIPDELRKEWKNKCIQQISYNTKCQYIQNCLPITVPYIILKGTSAARYYPYPEYRALGDIDIITKREDFDKALQMLLDHGYTITKVIDREIELEKNNIPVELHRYFASLHDPQKAKYMDDLIIENINPSHILPDEINGLVLLEHISQHLEKGLGLRQIIDWMMFVDECLPDNRWSEFQKYVSAIGLEQLAIVATKMCELYLGLPHREWCNQADECLCTQLMDYIMVCGNFGNSRSQSIGTGENVFYYFNAPKTFLHLLQERGLVNWKATKKWAFLRPFAWIYQMIRYATRGLNREDAFPELMKEYKAAKQRNKMFEVLGVGQSAKGQAIYKDGKYQKLKKAL